MSIKKIKETFTHINNNCKEEEYIKCESEWKHVQTFILKEQTPYHCNGYDTYWTSVQFINDHENICPKCDTYCQPFLCNSINWISVLEYINPKFHHYLILNQNNINTSLFLGCIKYDINDNNILLVDDKFNNFLDGLILKTLDFKYIGFYEEN